MKNKKITVIIGLCIVVILVIIVIQKQGNKENNINNEKQQNNVTTDMNKYVRILDDNSKETQKENMRKEKDNRKNFEKR